MAFKFVNGVNNYPNGQNGFWPVNVSLVDTNPFDDEDETVFDDSPTRAQNFRDELKLQELGEAQNFPQTVLPPEVETDANLPSRVISPETAQKRAFNPNFDMPQSYGAGRFKIFTQNHPEAVLQNLIAEGNQILQKQNNMEMMNKLFGGQ